jgi:hypothetical protein
MDEPTIRLQPGETAVVGYGSLLNVASIGRTLGHDYDGPFVHCRVDGWRRGWDVGMPNDAFYFEDRGERVYPARILYLNVRRQPGVRMNAAVFVLPPDELAAMHHRERIYDPLVVTGDVRGVRVEGGDAVMYVARPEHRLQGPSDAREAAVRRSYLQILERALERTDPAFRAEYASTTDVVPSALVIDDRLDPDRASPWT